MKKSNAFFTKPTFRIVKDFMNNDKFFLPNLLLLKGKIRHAVRSHVSERHFTLLLDVKHCSLVQTNQVFRQEALKVTFKKVQISINFYISTLFKVLYDNVIATQTLLVIVYRVLF